MTDQQHYESTEHNGQRSLEEMHNIWLRLYDDMVQAGATADEASESMLTIALATKVRIAGARHCAGRLHLIEGMLVALADESEGVNVARN